MGKRVDFKKLSDEAANKAADFLGKTKDKIANVMDQNDDGEFNVKDVAAVKDSLGKAATAIKDDLKKRNRELERRQLKPIFAEDLDGVGFDMSKLIRITEIDKKHKESEVCKGSIGFISPQKGINVVNVYSDKVDAFGLSFYPDVNSEIYYVDPCDQDRYIALDDYFSYLKEARIGELQKLAQDLGATHFKVTFKERKASFSKHNVNVKEDTKAVVGKEHMSSERNVAESDMASVEIVAESSFPGHEPVMPTLKYLRRDPGIESLIKLRMDKTSPMSSQKYRIELSKSSGIKEKDAVIIDAALKAMKISGNATVTSEVKNDARRSLEYEIEF